MLGFIISIPIYIPILPDILEILLSALTKITEIFSNIPISNILVCPPTYIVIFIYYAILLFYIYLKKLKRKNLQKKNRKKAINKCG